MSFWESKLIQTMVYWGNPVQNAFGSFTFDDPIEVSCRWHDNAVMFRDNNGDEAVSRAVIMIADEKVLNGYVYLGGLDDLTVQQKENPKLVIDAYQIKHTQSVVSLFSTNRIFRKIYV